MTFLILEPLSCKNSHFAEENTLQTDGASAKILKYLHSVLCVPGYTLPNYIPHFFSHSLTLRQVSAFTKNTELRITVL